MSDNSAEFVKQIWDLLQPKPANFTALDLFAGRGGLALGFEAAGFYTIDYEMNTDGCNTCNNNLVCAYTVWARSISNVSSRMRS